LISISLALREFPVVRAVPVVLADPIQTVGHPSTSIFLASQPGDPVEMADVIDRSSYSDQNTALLEEEEVNHLHLVDLHRSYPCPLRDCPWGPTELLAADRAHLRRHLLVSPL